MALDTYALVTLQEAKDWLGISVTTYDTILENLINATTARIEQYLMRQVKARDRIEFYDPDGSNTLLLRQYPVNSCRFVGFGSQVAVTVSASSGSTDASATVETQDDSIVLVRNTSAGSTNTTSTVTFASNPRTDDLATAIAAVTGFSASVSVSFPSRYLHPGGPSDVKDRPVYLTCPSVTGAGYRLERSTGILHLPRRSTLSWEMDDDDSGFGCERQTVVVDYNAGYATVPYDIVQACLELVGAAYKARFKDANVDSETLGDYSYTSAVRDAQGDMLERLLGGWREIR